MYIIKNAWLSLIRNKGRNLLIGIIILVLSIATCITLAIRSSADQLVNSYNSKYDIEATLGMNRDNMMKDFTPGEKPTEDEQSEQEKLQMPEIESLTVSEIEKYGDSEYVKNYYYTYRFNMNANIEKLSSSNSDDKRMDKKADDMNSGDFVVMGYDSYESMSDFISGKYTISDGEVSSDFTSDSCIISSELASSNDLKVGDTITLISPNNEELTYDLKITGIYKENEEDSDSMGQMFSDSANMIITNKTVSEAIRTLDEDISMILSPTFILTSEDVVDSFSEELAKKGLSDYYQVQTNLETINSETASIQNVAHFAGVFLIITLIIGGVVLFVLNMINVRERKYEIGVLRTIGMTKLSVSCQFVVELLIVTFISITLGIGIGSVLSVPTANYLLENEIESSQQAQTQVQQNFGGPQGEEANRPMGRDGGRMNGVMSLDKVTSMNAVVDIKVILQLFGICLLLTVISSLSAIVSIARFSPLTILRERS